MNNMKLKNKMLLGASVLISLAAVGNNTAKCLYESVKEEVVKQDQIKAFGIVIGKTTEEELRRRYSVTSTNLWSFYKSYKILDLNEDEFSLVNLRVKSVFAVVSPKGVVELLYLRIEGKVFAQLNPILEEKYSLAYKNEPSEGNAIARYKCGDGNILIGVPYLTPDSHLLYETENIAQFRRLALEREKAQEKRNLKDVL